VHLCRWPEYDERFRNPELERDMASVRHAVSMGRALRVTNDLKTRQPLASVQIVTKIAEEKKVLSGMEDILREELNVKSILFKDNEEDLVEYSIKANFRVLGKILGKEMKAAAAILEALDPASVSSIVAGFSIFIDVSGQKISIDQNSVEIRRTEKPGLKVLNEGTLTLALDTVVTPSLLREGYVRDLIRGVQNLRKESGLDVTDRINLIIAGDIELKKALDDFGDFVAGETLADSITWKEGRDENVSLVEAGEKTWYISLSRA
jgi:isoleucyl-tRNA synthetase